MQKQNIERYCQFHKNNLLEILHLSKDDKQHELCSICFQIDKKFKKSQIFFLNHILKAEQDTIIPNLPPFEDKQIHTFLSKQFYSQANQIQTKIEQINTYFENLKTNFDNTLKKVKVEMDKKIEILQGFKQNLIDTYNQVSSKQQLKNLYLENPKNLSEQVHEFISSKFEQIKSNTEKMQQSIKEFNAIYDNLSDEQPNQIRDTILNLITKIDFFSSFQIEEYAKLVKQHKEEDINSDENNNKLNTDILIDLINNKTNYCSVDFIVQLKQIFNKYELWLNQTKMNFKVNDKQKRDCFQNLNDEQLENIRVLSEKVQLIEKEYNNNNLTSFSEKIQPHSNLIINDLKSNFWNETNLVEQTFKKYPIFELDNLKNIILSQRIHFIKSQYNYSQQTQEMSFVNGKIQILKINRNANTMSYSNIKLDVKKKYIIRLHIQTNPNHNDPLVLFGLIQDNNKDDSYLYNSQLIYNERKDQNSFNRIIKGNEIASGRQNNINKQLEIRVHLEDKLIRIATYPDYENVSELDDQNKINQNTEYRFATQLHCLQDKITINEMFIVNEFDNKM